MNYIIRAKNDSSVHNIQVENGIIVSGTVRFRDSLFESPINPIALGREWKVFQLERFSREYYNIEELES